jgi:hypothetical protein
MEIAGPLMNGFSAIPAFEASRRWLRPLFLCGRVLHAAWTRKMDGYLWCHCSYREYAMRKVNIPALFGCHNQTDPLPGNDRCYEKYFSRGRLLNVGRFVGIGGPAGRNSFLISNL